MVKLKINPKYRDLIPPISKEEYDLLEGSILHEGCRDAIVTWNDTILDGHNRHEICHKHKIPHGTLEKEFSNEDEAKEWIIRNQLARRNLPAHERARLALLLKPAIEEKAKEQQGTRIDIPQKSAKGFKPIDTRQEIAKLAGVSHDTVRKVEIIEKEATEEVKQATRKGEMSVNKAYQTTKNPVPLKSEESDALFQLKKWWKRANGKDRRLLFHWIINHHETPKGYLLDIIHSENPEFQKSMKEDRKKRRAGEEGNYSGLNK
jgi:hypothetical protein